jgi:RNA polymerase sigma-70 factor (ECF subfamily)
MQKVEIRQIGTPIGGKSRIRQAPTNPIWALPRTVVDGAVDPANGPLIRSSVGEHPTKAVLGRSATMLTMDVAPARSRNGAVPTGEWIPEFSGLFGMLESVASEDTSTEARAQQKQTADTAAAELQLLVSRIASGDQLAFGDFYDRLASRVFAIVRRVLVDPSQSEEVTQEIFVELWQTAPRYAPNKGGVTTWVMTIAHRRAVDRVRASQASRERDLKVGIRDHAVDYDSVAETAELRLENERVERALLNLTDLQREAVTLAYYGGYSHSEVSEMLGVPLGTVKTRIRDGMIRLRDEMGVAS